MIKPPSEYYPCECLQPQKCIDKKTTDIKFVVEYGYFQISYKTHIHEEMKHSLWFCPFCGGKMSGFNSSRLKQHSISKQEEERLKKLTVHIKSIEDAYEILGKPNVHYEQHTYENLSDEANLTVYKVKTGDEWEFETLIVKKSYKTNK